MIQNAPTEKPKLHKADIVALQAIRAAIKATYWIKGEYRRTISRGKHTGEFGYCMVGLVNRQCAYAYPDGSHIHRHGQRGRILSVLEWAIKQYVPRSRVDAIEGFNDRDRTKREDVLAVLDIALKGEKS